MTDAVYVALCPPCHAQTDAAYMLLVVIPSGSGRFVFELWAGTGKETSQVVERWEIPWFPSAMEPAPGGREIYTSGAAAGLEAKGYTVLDTGDPQQAVRLATQQPVHLLLTDVVMPLLRGTELAQRFEAISPWTKVLLMSAYKVSDRLGVPIHPQALSPDALVAKVRQVLLTQPSPFARRTPPRSAP